MKKKSTSKLAFFNLRVLPSLVAAAFIAFALALSNAAGDATFSCGPTGTAYWPGAATPSPYPTPSLLTAFYFTGNLSTPRPVLVLRGCGGTTQDLCSFWTPSPTPPYHMVVQETRGSPGCLDSRTPFIGDLLFKFDQDDSHALLENINLQGWGGNGGDGHLAMLGWSRGGVISYLAAPGAGTYLRGIQPHYATGDLLNYGLFNGGVQHKEIPYPVDLQWPLWRVADFDHDGKPDYVLYNRSTSETAVWYLNNNNPITVRTTASGPTITGWQLQAVADFDHDTIPDYVLYNPGTGETAVWYLMNVNSNPPSLGVREVRPGPTITPGWQLVTVGDFDGDLNPDYVLYNASTRATGVWYLNNDLTRREARGGPIITAGWYLVGVDDFDQDGTPDYVLYAPTTRQTAVWYLINSSPTITLREGRFGPTISQGWLPDAVDDFDHDGTPDYVLYALSGQATAVWYLMNSNSNPPSLAVREGRFGPTSSAKQISWKDYVGLGIWNKYLITASDAGLTKVAGLHVGGWFDVFGQGTLDSFSRLKTAGGTDPQRQQKVIIGPWIHGGEGVPGPVGQITFPNSTIGHANFSDYDTKWKQCVFEGNCTAWKDTLPAVKVYLMSPGATPGGVWTTYSTWPPPAQEKTFYFTVNPDGTGGLSGVLPTSTPQLTFTSNPSSPCPTLGGTNNLTSCTETGENCGPYDQSPIENDRTRRDFVVFTSGPDPLSNGGPIVGRMYADVWIKTNLPDVDVFVRMTDVYPDGTSMLMAQGIQRARYRNGACPQFLNGTATKVRVDLGSTALVLQPQHKLRVIVSASAGPNHAGGDPLYSVNPQNRNEYIGEPPNSTPTSGTINVLAGTGQASVLVIPVPTPGPTPPDHRPPKPTPCPQ